VVVACLEILSRHLASETKDNRKKYQPRTRVLAEIQSAQLPDASQEALPLEPTRWIHSNKYEHSEGRRIA
jgi:hypothetical protein